MGAFEFEITIQSQSEPGSWPVVVRCKQPDGLTIHARENLQLDEEAFIELVKFLESEKEYGLRLGKALFHGSIRDNFARAVAKSSEEYRLRILLSIEAADNDKIRTLHWERLCAPIESDGGWQLLARDQRIPFSLYIPTVIDRRFAAIGRRDLRALILIASPSNIGKFQLAPFDVEAALEGVKTALGEIPYDVLANGVEGALGPPTLPELSKQLTSAKKPYTLLHFICHGMFQKDGETVLYWAQADNQVSIVTAENLIGELKNVGGGQKTLPHFAFLCTCQSADPRAEGALGGLAQRLVRNLGMPAVVAMTRKVTVETALKLGQNFYQRLRESGEVDTALQQATAGLGTRHDITVPALFSRLGGRPLFSDRWEGRELSDVEIEEGLDKFDRYLQERAPHAAVLQQSYRTQVEIFKKTRGSQVKADREARHDALVELNSLCQQVIEIDFNSLAALGKEPPLYDAECPFPGLSSFGDPKYHKYFFGRDALVKALRKQLEEDNFLAVLGPSGSGKSSVVLAGLVPNLEAEYLGLKALIIKPGSDPLEKSKRVKKALDRHSVLVVDQFEELFTLCESEEARKRFIQDLFEIAKNKKVIITIRADFLGECTFYPELRKRIEAQQKLVGPMQPDELIAAMTMQANQAGLRFETGLSQDILDDVKEEPGAMPLLQYALQELWQRRRGRWLCGEEYIAIGRVQRAIAKTADDFYHRLSEGEQQQVQNIFLRLTRLDDSASAGETQRDTRRRVELEALVSTQYDLAATQKLVQQLAGEGARLVVTSRNETTGKDEVEVAHEALIRHWQTLKDWIKQNRNDLQLRESIAVAAREWQAHKEQTDRENYLVHKGGRLDDADVLRRQPKLVQLNPLETEYVEACVQHRDRTLQQEKRRLKRQLAAAAIGVAVSTGLAIVAGFQLRQAEIQKVNVLLQSVETSSMARQTLDAKVGSLRAAKAYQQAILQKLWPAPELKQQVWSKLLSTYYRGQEINHIEDGRYPVSVTIDQDGRLAIGYQDGIRLWNPKSQQFEPFPNSNFSQTSFILENGVKFSPNGRFLAIAASLMSQPDEGGVYLLDTQTQQHKELPDSKGVDEVLFSADSKFLVSTKFYNGSTTYRDDGNVRRWDTETGKVLDKIPLRGVESLELSPDGKLQAKISEDGTASLEDTRTKKLKFVLQKRDDEKFRQVGFSPDSKFLVAIRNDERNFENIDLWDIKTKKITPVSESLSVSLSLGSIKRIIFSPDSKLIAIITNNTGIWVSEVEGKLKTILPTELMGVDSAVFNSDNRQLVTSDRTIRFWDISEQTLPVIETEKADSKLSLDGKNSQLVTLDKDGTLRFWNDINQSIALRDSNKQFCQKEQISAEMVNEYVKPNTEHPKGYASSKLILRDANGKKWQVKLSGAPEESQEALTFILAPDCQHLAVLGYEQSSQPEAELRLWLGSTLARSLAKRKVKEISSMAFSPNSQFLVLGSRDGTLQLWDSRGNLLNGKLAQLEDIIVSIAFSPKDAFMATGTDRGSVQVWGNRGSPMSLLHTGNLIKLFELQTEQFLIQNIMFSRDGKQLVVFTGDEEKPGVYLYQIEQDLDKLIAMNCEKVRNYLKNPNNAISDEDRQLCNGVPLNSNSPQK